MKKSLVTLFLLLAVSVFAGTQIALETPVDVSAYCGAGTAAKIDLLSINYETGEVRFRLLDATDVPLGNGAVFGIALQSPVDQDGVKAAVLAAIAAAKENAQ